MKKLTIFSAFFLLSVLMASCVKHIDPAENVLIVGKPDSTIEYVKKASDWLSLNFNPVTERSIVYLKGEHELETHLKYDRAHHIELVYSMTTSNRITEYKRLPMKLFPDQNFQDKMYLFNSSLNERSFIITINNEYDPQTLPNISFCENFRFRYIIIPKPLFESLNINWDDYLTIAQALNI